MTKAEKLGLQKHIGLRICMAREIAGFTQAELATQIGVGRSQLTNIELGNSDTTATMIVAIARAIGIKSSRLLP